MKEIPQNLRAIVVNYRFNDHLTFLEIAKRVRGVTEAGARQLCYRTRKRAGSDNITKILANSAVAPRTGAPRRVEPGSTELIRIRNAVRGRHKF